MEQLGVLRSLINSPRSVLSALTLAHEEMLTIKEVNSALFQGTRHRLLLVFAEEDDWVGSNKETILREVGHESTSVIIHNARHGIPHAYCISKRSSIVSELLHN